jgi:hypothetical protein
MDILPRRAPTIETELTNTEQQTGLVPKLIMNDPKNNFINPSAFKKLSSLNSAYKTYAESSDGDISNNFTADNSPAYTGKQLSFNPTRNVSLFESQFEKDVRTGNLFELRRAQVQNNVFNIIGTAQTPSYLR